MKSECHFQALGKEMTKEQFEEILLIQQLSADLAAPGGLGQVPKKVNLQELCILVEGEIVFLN